MSDAKTVEVAQVDEEKPKVATAVKLPALDISSCPLVEKSASSPKTQGEDSESISPSVQSDGRKPPFKKRRRKRGRTASERLNWEEDTSSPAAPQSPSSRAEQNNSDSDSSCGEERGKPVVKPEEFKQPGSSTKTSKRKRKKKIILRPAEPGAPENSTSFIIDSHVETTGLYYDFSSPSPASQRCEYFRHMQESFESEYSSARAGEFEKMTKEELLAKVVQLEHKENELRKVIESFDPAIIEQDLNERLIAAQQENRNLKAKMAEFEANPTLMDFDSTASHSSDSSSSGSSSSTSGDSSSDDESQADEN